MPFIQTKTNVSVSKELELSLKTAFGKAIELIPGKSERWLMLSFSDNERMWFVGDDAPLAYLSVKLFGAASDGAYDALTAKLTEIVSAQLNIPSSRIYVKYEEIDHWGWNGSNF
ncbi:MAG: tautomerase family protein [Clostridia bacterium]|nr:tautomerase family protein [Clostridia bacterium]